MINIISGKELMLDNILLYFSGKTFSQRQAVEIVGGLGKLMSLIVSGEVEAEKPLNVQNSKWRVKSDQVLRHCKMLRR
mgnify:FL=1